MVPHNYGTGNHSYVPPATSGTATPPAGYYALSTLAPAPGYPLSLPSHTHTQTRSRSHSRTPTPTAPILNPVPVPPGHYPIELVQFYRPDPTLNPPYFMHWALFVRTAPRPPSPSLGQGHTPATGPTSRSTALGHFYELVGTTETYTAQFFSQVHFEPETLPDWRGTHVIGWTSAGQLPAFERAARQARVVRYQPDWRCHQWVYDVLRTVGAAQAQTQTQTQGLFVQGVTLGTLQRHMARLLEAWENGDI